MIFKTLRYIMRLIARAHTSLYRRDSTAENAFDGVVMFCATRPLYHMHCLLFEITWSMQQRRIDRINRAINAAQARLGEVDI